MPKSMGVTLDLDVDLQSGVVPISKAASALAALIKRGTERQQPIIVTQKGYPTGVLLPIELYSTLRDMAQREGLERGGAAADAPAPDVAALNDVPADSEHAVAAVADRAAAVALEAPASDDEAPAPPRARGGRRAKAAR